MAGRYRQEVGGREDRIGLLYKIERPGDADTIAVDDRDVVVVNYEGKNRKGKVFDSSYERNEPAEFPLNRVIKGWTEGMKLVGKGGKITLWIPAELALRPSAARAAISGPTKRSNSAWRWST